VLTYRGENRPREANDGDVAQGLGDDDNGDFRQCFSSRNGSGGGGDGRGSSSKWWLITGSFDAVGHRVWQAWAMARF
jgi:hypothetical protein